MQMFGKFKCFTSRKLFQYLAVISGSLNILSSGMHYGWPSPTIPKLLEADSHIPITEDESSWIILITLFGTICGAFLGYAVVDKLGRKTLILFTSIPFIASWLMIAFAKSAWILIFARFISGLGDGSSFCAFPMYMAEISDPKIRGMFGSWISMMLILGILITNVMGFYLSYFVTPLICLTVPLLLLVTFSWMPESPYYLLMKGKMEEARRALKIFNGTNDVEKELERLSTAIEEQGMNTAKYTDLFTVKSNRKAVLIIVGVLTTQQFTGSTAILFYANTIFEESKSSLSPVSASSLYFAIQLLLVGISSILIDRCGKRPLLIISSIGSGIGLFIQGCYFSFLNMSDIDISDFSWVPVAALIIFVISFSIGMQSIPIILVSELFPTNVKAFAVSFSSNYYAIITFISSKFFQITKDQFGLQVPFLVFGGCCVLGLIHIIYCVPETKSKTLEEIQLELVNEVPPPHKINQGGDS